MVEGYTPATRILFMVDSLIGQINDVVKKMLCARSSWSNTYYSTCE